MKNQLWSNRPFVVLSVAQLLSSFGNWILYLAVMILIAIRWHHGPLAVSLGLVSLMAPGILIRPYAGVLADRWDRKRLMLVSDTVSGVVALSLLAVQNLWQLYLVLVLLGAIDTFFSPAESGMIKEVVPNSAMGQAMSIRMMIAQGTKVVGPSLSGLLATWFGPRIPFAIDGMCFLASAAIIAFLRGGREHLRTPSVKTPQSSYWDGVRYLKRTPFLGVLVMFFSVMLLVLQMVDSEFVILVRPLVGASRLLGLIMSASGVGMALAALLMQKLRVQKPLQWMASGAVFLGLGFGGTALLADFRIGWAIPLVALFAGGAVSLALIPFQTALQQKTPTEWTGRVQAAVGTATSVSVVVGPLLGGTLIGIFGVIPTFLWVSTLLVLVGGATGMLSWGRGRAIDHAQSEPAVQEGTTGEVNLRS